MKLSGAARFFIYIALANIIIFLNLMYAEAANNYSDYRPHLAFCNNNKDCAREQKMAHDLFYDQKWDGDLRQLCSKRFITNRFKNNNYSLALDCVYRLQISRDNSAINRQYGDFLRRQ